MKIELDKETLTDGSDASISVIDEAGGVLAKCSLWFATNALGHFETKSAEAASLLFEAAEKTMRQAGCISIVGPMDGKTWRRYRLVTKSDGRAPFFLEPQNPTEWPEYFLNAGWGVAATYTSSSVDLTSRQTSPSIQRVEKRLSSAGVSFRRLDPESFAEELQGIYDVSTVSFRDNFLYSPISFEDFSAMYLKIESMLVPELSLIAYGAKGNPIGFVFALPDPTHPDTVIIKTLAVLPERRFAGLGSLLVDQVQQTSKKLGFTTALHALQHQNNSALKISSRNHAKTFREYTLYEKHL